MALQCRRCQLIVSAHCQHRREEGCLQLVSSSSRLAARPRTCVSGVVVHQQPPGRHALPQHHLAHIAMPWNGANPPVSLTAALGSNHERARAGFRCRGRRLQAAVQSKPEDTISGVSQSCSASIHCCTLPGVATSCAVLTSHEPAASLAASSSRCASPPAHHHPALACCTRSLTQSTRCYITGLPAKRKPQQGCSTQMCTALLIKWRRKRHPALRLRRSGSAAVCHALLSLGTPVGQRRQAQLPRRAAELGTEQIACEDVLMTVYATSSAVPNFDLFRKPSETNDHQLEYFVRGPGKKTETYIFALLIISCSATLLHHFRQHPEQNTCICARTCIFVAACGM